MVALVGKSDYVLVGMGAWSQDGDRLLFASTELFMAFTWNVRFITGFRSSEKEPTALTAFLLSVLAEVRVLE